MAAKKPGRVGWSIAGGLLFGAVSALDSIMSYRRLLARGAWTAAALAIPLSAVYVLACVAVGALLGWSIWAVFVSGSAEVRRKAIGPLIVTLGLSIWWPVRTYTQRVQIERLETLRTTPLTADKARELFGAFDRGPSVRVDELSALAANPTCPPELLVTLSGYESYTQAAVAANAATPLPTLQALSRSPDSTVRYYTVYNKTLPQADLERLAHDSSSSVSKAAEQVLGYRSQRSEGK